MRDLTEADWPDQAPNALVGHRLDTKSLHPSGPINGCGEATGYWLWSMALRPTARDAQAWQQGHLSNRMQRWTQWMERTHDRLAAGWRIRPQSVAYQQWGVNEPRPVQWYQPEQVTTTAIDGRPANNWQDGQHGLPSLPDKWQGLKSRLIINGLGAYLDWDSLALAVGDDANTTEALSWVAQETVVNALIFWLADDGEHRPTLQLIQASREDTTPFDDLSVPFADFGMLDTPTTITEGNDEE